MQLTGSSNSDVWAIGTKPGSVVGNTVWHFDGKQWKIRLEASFDVKSIWSSGPSDVWIAGTNGSILRYDGATDSWGAKTSHTSSALNDIWASSADDVWFAGEGGTLLHWDGQTMKAVQSGTQEPLLKLAGRASDDLWASGGRGVILHYAR